MSSRNYLEARSITELPDSLMLLPAKTAQKLGLALYPRMVMPVTDADGRLLGAHTTMLTRDAKRRIKGKKRSYGKIGGGFAQLGEIDPDGACVIGEGIESALSAMQLAKCNGIAALSATNMAKVNPPPAKEYVVATDNDAPGRQAAAELAERLQYEGRSVRVVAPIAEKADWNDVLRDGGGEDAWRTACDAKAADSSPDEPTGKVLALEESKFMELQFPKRELLLAPWLPRPGLAMIYAPKGEGKTWFALTVAKAEATGQDFLGWRAPNYARVLYVEGELPGQSVQERLSRFQRSPPGTFHVLCRDAFLLRRAPMPDLGEAEGRRELDRIIKQCRPDVIIIDTISTMVRSGVENDAESWAPIQAWLLNHRWRGRTVILMHHTGKSGQQRGTSKREDVMDTIIKLKKQPDECTATESVFDLTFEKSRDFFGKDAEPMRLRFSIENGQARWRGEALRDARREKIQEMLSEGAKQKDIARELGITEARVSQIVREMRAADNVVPFPGKGGDL